MFTIYVLYSPGNDKIYIGYTSNLIARFHAHNELDDKGWSRKFRPWMVVYTEVFEHKHDAVIREKQLKSSRGRAFIRDSVLKDYT